MASPLPARRRTAEVEVEAARMRARSGIIPKCTPPERADRSGHPRRAAVRTDRTPDTALLTFPLTARVLTGVLCCAVLHVHRRALQRTGL
jgi:hypothetical protein